MKFGTKKKDAPEQNDAGGMYLRTFKDGETVVRFLEETDDWIVFREHYLNGKSFPCTGDRDSCPGCTHPDESVQKAGRKYATNAWLPKQNAVLPFRIPISLAKSLFTRSEKNDGTITNRDYVIMRSGKGLDTEYDVDSDDKYAVDVASLLKQGVDIQEVLQASYDEVWGEEPREERFSRKPKEAEEETFPSRSEVQGESADDSEIVLDEDRLYEMSLAELVDVADKVGIDVREGTKKGDLIRTLLAASV